MPRFLFIGNYTPDAVKTIMATGGTARRAALEKLFGDLGGRMESMHFAFGADDVYVIAELPGSAAAAAASLTVNATGIAATRTVVLMSPEELDEVAKLRPEYRPPTAG